MTSAGMYFGSYGTTSAKFGADARIGCLGIFLFLYCGYFFNKGRRDSLVYASLELVIAAFNKGRRDSLVYASLELAIAANLSSTLCACAQRPSR